LKTDGNEHFKRGEYKEAIDKYTEAIAKCPTNEHRELSTYYQNRAAAHEKMVC
jgi:import receptor subunit TOM70